MFSQDRHSIILTFTKLGVEEKIKHTDSALTQFSKTKILSYYINSNLHRGKRIAVGLS